MHPAVLVIIYTHFPCVTGIITNHWKCFIIIICHNDSSQFSRLRRFIGIQFQNLRIKIIQVNRIFRILIKLDCNKAIFIISIGPYRRKSEQLFCQIISFLRKCFSHRKYHFNRPAADISSCFSNILSQRRQCTGIRNQNLNLLLFNITADFIQ